MKKLNITLTWNVTRFRWSMSHAGQPIGDLCGYFTNKVLGIQNGKNYNLALVQQETRRHANLKIVPKNSCTDFFILNNPSVETPMDSNLFMSYETDKFVRDTFGREPFFIRVKVTEIA